MSQLKSRLFLIFFAVAGILFFTHPASAMPFAPTHDTAQWQDIVDITWSTDQVHWGNETLSVGDTVYFKFEMHKDYVGTHYADLLKVWIDWDQDNKYEESESFFFSHVISATPVSNSGAGLDVDEYYSFFSAGFLLTDENLGDIDILVRVTCAESLLQAAGYRTRWEDQWRYSMEQYDALFHPFGNLWQGEAETRTLTVTDPVPEPATMLLFGVGLVGFAGVSRRMK